MAYNDTDASATGLLGAGFGVLQRNAALLGAYGLTVAIIQVIQKVQSTTHLGGAAGAFIVAVLAIVARIVAGAVFSQMALKEEGLVAQGTPLLIGTYIGVSFVVGLVSVLGFILLLVPGLIVYIRWYLASNFVLARGMGISDALGASRDATKGHRWSIFGALVLIGLIFAVPGGVLVLAAGGLAAYQALPLLSLLSVVVFVFTAVAGALGLAVAVGIYATLAGRESHLDDVFG